MFQYNPLKEYAKLLGKDKISQPQSIFENLQGQPPQLAKKRYRANHSSAFDLLDSMEHMDNLIKSDDRGEVYCLSPYALPLIPSSPAEKLLKIMKEIYGVLQEIYNNQFNQPVSNTEIMERISHSKNDVLEALSRTAERERSCPNKNKQIILGAQIERVCPKNSGAFPDSC
ncbi:MAG: hypothetical protein DHS20C02_10820 [Micavibrio sp.]|nr:MAG: hypothetical protein DHS20C02_10820 [Micavibrio sp.]